MIRITFISEHDGQEHIVYAQEIHFNSTTIVGTFMNDRTRIFNRKEVTSINDRVHFSGISVVRDAAKT